MERSSGVLMHISSLPSNYGIGTLGVEAYNFVDFLEKTKQKYWQILPLGHTSFGDSPYQSFSAFAGNPYFIDLDILINKGYLKASDVEQLATDESQIDYKNLFDYRYPILHKAYKKSKLKHNKDYINFCDENKFWLEDYALFMSLKALFNQKEWQLWDDDIKFREQPALIRYAKELETERDFWRFIQFEFFAQWFALKDYANEKGIQFIGDIPIYVASDSSDTWANGKFFMLDENKQHIGVAGCPPDYFSETGQLWGNPTYNWDVLKQNDYKWWVKRMEACKEIFDVVRIDHFRGFESYWEIPFGEETAINGVWKKGPGIELFNEIKKQLGDISIIAEDLGLLTQEVYDFRDETGFPGMKILQFAFHSNNGDYIPHNCTKNSVVYTGTHDNDTIVGWFNGSGGKEEIEYAIDYLHLTEEETYHWGMIRGMLSTVCDIAIATTQDLLGLDTSSRMNIPSVTEDNWVWRMEKDALNDEIAEKLLSLTCKYGRECPKLD